MHLVVGSFLALFVRHLSYHSRRMGWGHLGIAALLQKTDKRWGISVWENGGIVPAEEIFGSKEDGISTLSLGKF